MLGVLEAPYISEKIELNSSDTIIFYTDGVTEAFDIDENEFGEDRFEDFLLDKNKLHPEEISNQLFDSISDFRGDAEQSDDITIGILKIK